MTGDVNRDGHVDLVVVDRLNPNQQQQVVALLGNGAAVFQVATPTPLLGPNQGIYSPVLADFDGDGLLDVGGMGPLIAFGDGSGAFGPVVNDPTPAGTSGAGLAADFNTDGKADFAFFTATPQIISPNVASSLSILLSQGRTFGSTQALRASAGSLASGDFNGDGIPDLLIVDTNAVQTILMNVLQ